MINPGTVAALFALVFYVANLNLPHLLMLTIDYAGRATTFLSMMVLGAAVARMQVGRVIRNYRLIIFSLVRLTLIPLILLFIPIFDTFSAIIRRRLNHQPISSPDKKHFHHILMNKLSLGQTGATITIYIITAIFGITAYIYINNTTLGLFILLLLIMIFEIFIEYTGMISTSYRPILNLLDRIAKKHYRAEDETKSDE